MRIMQLRVSSFYLLNFMHIRADKIDLQLTKCWTILLGHGLHVLKTLNDDICKHK